MSYQIICRIVASEGKIGKLPGRLWSIRQVRALLQVLGDNRREIDGSSENR
jgi:hypothetical protein